MASIISGNINLSKIDKSKIYEGKKGKYYPVTVVINNEVGEYGDSGYIMTEQSKEEREMKADKQYLGNVKEFLIYRGDKCIGNCKSYLIIRRVLKELNIKNIIVYQLGGDTKVTI